MLIKITTDYRQLGRIGALYVARAIQARADLVLGLAAGRTPVSLYEELVALYRQGLDFSKVRTFNLDEYVGLGGEDPRSFRYFVHHRFLAHVNVPPEHCRSPNGLAPDLDEESRRYEEDIRRAGGLDLVILGIGHNGHIAFNEPGSSPLSRTRVVTLTWDTRQRHAAYFGGVEKVPPRAITMGMATILESRQLLLLAAGAAKREVVRRALQGPITPEVPASFLLQHPHLVVILDQEAAGRDFPLPAEWVGPE